MIYSLIGYALTALVLAGYIAWVRRGDS